MFAWTNRESPDDLVRMAARFPRLGLVLKPTGYAAVERLKVPPIAYLGSVAQAETVAAWARAGYKWHAAIVNDERNADGPSGGYMTPEAYAAQFIPIRDTLQAAGVRVGTMGLQAINRRFDDAYHRHLPDADLRAFNPNKVRLTEVNRVAAMPGPWVFSPAPFRGCWDRFWHQPISERQWATIAARPNVHAVALWCLQEIQWGNGTWQHEHGLLDRHGNLTKVGRAVLAAL